LRRSSSFSRLRATIVMPKQPTSCFYALCEW
jgi:hypothetical protein